jgi:hypothetical protein
MFLDIRIAPLHHHHLRLLRQFVIILHLCIIVVGFSNNFRLLGFLQVNLPHFLPLLCPNIKVQVVGTVVVAISNVDIELPVGDLFEVNP